MNAVVLDTSPLLALYLGEPTAEWAARQMQNADRLLTSTVNLAECLIILRSHQLSAFEALSQRLLASSIEFVPPDVSHSAIVADARIRYPLNLGDGQLMDAAILDGSGERPTVVVRRFNGRGIFMSAAPGAAALRAATRTLDVAGTGGDDTIWVRRRGDRLCVRINNGPVRAFNTADVDTILVHGDAGNDAIDLRLGGPAKAVRLTGGAGRDTLLADHSDATLDGGADDDTLRDPRLSRRRRRRRRPRRRRPAPRRAG